MVMLENLRAETNALREFLRDLAEVLAMGANQEPAMRDDLRLAWVLADGVVQANEAFMLFPDPPVEMVEEFLEITRDARRSLEQVGPVVERLLWSDADDPLMS